MRLNLYIAKSGYCSRRKADALIKKGAVEVNGKKILEPFFDVREGHEVKIQGRLITPQNYAYILFNKPAGVTTTVSDRFAAKKVVDFLPKELKGAYPVGRLDKNSSGLIILTNDGSLCYRLTHPKFCVEKEYLIELEGEAREDDLRRAKKGLKDEGELLKIDSAKILKKSKKTSLCKVTVHEGKKRHLRRLFKGLGFKVRSLKRVRIGRVVLGGLKTGKYKIVSKSYILQKDRP